MIHAYKFFKNYYKNNFKKNIYIFSSFVTKCCALAIPYLTKLLIDQIQFSDLNNFKKMSLLLVLIMIIFCIFLSINYFVQNDIEVSALNELKKDMLKKIFSIKNEKIINISTGEFIQKVFNDTEITRPLIISTYVECILNIVYSISIVIIMFSMNKVITISLLILFPIFAIFYKVYVPKIEHINKKIINEDEKIKSLAEEILTGSLDIKVNSAYDFIENKIKDRFKKYLQFVLCKVKYLMQYDYILVTGIMNFATLLIYCLGGYLVFKNIISIGTLISFTLYFSRLWTPVEYFMELSKEVKIQLISLKRVEDFLKIECEEKGNKKITNNFEELRFEDFKLSYDDRVIFKNLNFHILKGDKIGIKGDNGAGKSTLAKVITKLINQYEGQVYYNNVNYNLLSGNDLRKKIIYIPSKTFLFNGSISENMTLRVNSSKLIINKLVEQWNCKSLIDILSKNNRNLETIINNQSNNLSGGEQKIIQILRGIFLNGDVYILDEPFNYIDKKYKQILIDFIKENLKFKTLIIISHDEDVFECCNKVYNLRKNSIEIENDFNTK